MCVLSLVYTPHGHISDHITVGSDFKCTKNVIYCPRMQDITYLSIHLMLEGAWLWHHKFQKSATKPWKKNIIGITSLSPRWNRCILADDIFKCIFLNEKTLIWLKFHQSSFPRVRLTIFYHWFRWWLGTRQATSDYLNRWWLVYEYIYASLSLNELTQTPLLTHFMWMNMLDANFVCLQWCK